MMSRFKLHQEPQVNADPSRLIGGIAAEAANEILSELRLPQSHGIVTAIILDAIEEAYKLGRSLSVEEYDAEYKDFDKIRAAQASGAAPCTCNAANRGVEYHTPTCPKSQQGMARVSERRIPEQSSDNMSPEAHPDTGIAPAESGEAIVYYDYLGRKEVQDK